MAQHLHQDNFGTNLTSGTNAGDTTSPLNSVPSIAAPFYIAFDATNINGHYEVKDITSKTATNVLHSALSYSHTTNEEVRMVIPAVELDDIITRLYAGDYFYTGMSRQAIMNGNFDIWQRGTSLVVTDAGVSKFIADRWIEYSEKNGGTAPTITVSRQLQASGDIANSFYFHRWNVDGAGTSLGVSSFGVTQQKIENGTRNLCGASKKVTVSFWARSSITNKRICPTLHQNYGTGGSPSSQEAILGTPITLTSSWVKYTVTFTTNTLVGKTFGTNGDDWIGLNLWMMWGTTWGNANVQASVTAETYVGAGNIDIAQVQLCAGDVALPFQPKSFDEELLACQRYYEIGETKRNGYNITGGVDNCFVNYKVQKRIAVVPVLVAGSHANCSASSTIDTATVNHFSSYVFITATNTFNFADTFSVNAEL